MDRNVCGRFAPSPTGEMHLGNAWTALIAWLYVRSRQGKVILRLEDLDPDRSKERYSRLLLQDLAWLGLDYDEGPGKGPDLFYRQSERRNIYSRYLEKLQKQGMIYSCFCSRAQLHSVSQAPHSQESLVYPGTCRALSVSQREEMVKQGKRPAFRLKVMDQPITFVDEMYGTITENLLETTGDFIVCRSDGVHAYQLAVVVDDALMGVTHVVRGSDLLISTARQIYLYQLLGFKVPSFVHVPLLYGDDGHRLSKRQKDLSLAALRSRGVSARMVIGYLAWLAGWRPKIEPATPRELISEFQLSSLPKNNIIVREKELAHLG